MGTEITYHNTDAVDFDNLQNLYTNGRYDTGEVCSWFSVVIAEMNLELTWFKAFELKRPNGETYEN